MNRLKQLASCLAWVKSLVWMGLISILQRTGRKLLSKAVNSTDAALARKICKSQAAKARLDKCILDADLEMQNLSRSLAKLSKLAGRRRASLRVTEKRLEVKLPSSRLTSILPASFSSRCYNSLLVDIFSLSPRLREGRCIACQSKSTALRK
jgi:hypothetical protein